MTVHRIIPIIDKSVRGLCCKPYPNHPKGCPNFNKRVICPPQAPMIGEFFDLSKEVLAVCIHFDLKSHIDRMRTKHLNWTQRQLECCLYWQGTARKQLREEIKNNMPEDGLFGDSKLGVTDCPEAMGVNVTETMKNVGVILEWPPKVIVRKIAFIGTLKCVQAEGSK